MELAIINGCGALVGLRMSIRANLVLAEKRMREGLEHGGARRRLCSVEADAALAKARHLRGILTTIEERQGLR